MSKPSPTSYPVYFKKYVDQVPGEDLLTAFSDQMPVVKELFDSISEDQSMFAYDSGKWTLKELLQHMIDSERIFNYRALCFARKETISLPGFEENDYAANSNANARSWNELVNEFLAVRQATELMYKSFTAEMLATTGISNNNPATVNSLGFITVGHVYHHKKVMEEKYFPAMAGISWLGKI